MDIEKLYQDVWAQVFAKMWTEPGTTRGEAVSYANRAAEYAVSAWDPAQAHAVIAAKAKAS